MIYACCWRADSQRFLTVSRDKRVKEWNTAGECLRTYKAEGEATSCVYLEEGRAAIGLETGDVLVMKIDQEMTVEASAKQTASITTLATAPGLLFSAGADFTVRIYTLPSFR
jgi:WD40 repeat protein